MYENKALHTAEFDVNSDNEVEMMCKKMQYYSRLYDLYFTLCETSFYKYTDGSNKKNEKEKGYHIFGIVIPKTKTKTKINEKLDILIAEPTSYVYPKFRFGFPHVPKTDNYKIALSLQHGDGGLRFLRFIDNDDFYKKIFQLYSANKIDKNILKIDSAFEETIKILNNPPKNYNHKELINNLIKFNGNLVIQTLFIRGKYNNHIIDNTNDSEIEAWLNLIQRINPQLVMIYTIKRNTPTPNLYQIPYAELKIIAKKVEKLNIKTQISY